MIPSFSSYGQYKSSNYGAHTLVFTYSREYFYFSYKTLVAFYRPSTGLVVRKNDWGPTTGKHLNWIDGGSKEAREKRVDADTFAKLFNQEMQGVKE